MTAKFNAPLGANSARNAQQNWFVRWVYSIARKLRSDRLIYLLFGIGDGLSNASSLISLALQIVYNDENPSTERMHFWLMTPLGIALTVIQATFLTLFAILGSYFTDKKDGSLKSFMARYWPYVRDSIKGFKGAYKAIRSVLFIAVVFAAVSVTGLLLPLGIAFGAAALLSRAWNRNMCSHRLAMQNANGELSKWNVLDMDDYKKWREKEPGLTEDAALLKQRKNALTNNPLLKLLIARLYFPHYQEKKNTRPLDINRLIGDLTDAQLRSLIQEETRPRQALKSFAAAGFFGLMNGLYMYAGLYMVCLLTPPLALVVSIFSIAYVIISIARELYEEYVYQIVLERSVIKAKLDNPEGLTADTIARLEAREAVLKKATYGSAVGEAFRNGLCAYNGLTGCLFAVVLFTPVPLMVLMSVIVVGAASLIAFVGYELYITYQCRKNNQPKDDKNARPDWLELLRSFALGIRQGPKFILNLILNHIRTSKAAFVVMCIVSGIQSIICTLKALAKGLGDPLKPRMPLNMSSGDLTKLVGSQNNRNEGSPMSALSKFDDNSNKEPPSFSPKLGGKRKSVTFYSEKPQQQTWRQDAFIPVA
ncbi:MAG: hypothetical protein NTW08_09255 [Gammaproteobacteria bacterium]|nr:hypothetical protein [Gammaproteobacteria bacterium]